MRLWPRSLRGRLILTVTLTMVATQLVIWIGASQKFGQIQRTERSAQMARQIAFVKPIIEQQDSLPIEVPIPGFAEKLPALLFEMAAKGMPPPVIKAPSMQPGGFLPPRSPRAEGTLTITAAAPPTNGDEDLLLLARQTMPSIVQISYRETGGFLSTGPHRPYAIEIWTRLDGPLHGNRYLHIVLDEPGDEGRAPGRFPIPYIDLVMRGGIGILLALLITSWIAKPLARLAKAADDTLPNGDIKPGADKIEIHHEPAEIAHALRAYERMRTRIGSMVAERTTMLTALAHDLRTPITRLMLRAEMSRDEKLREDALRDLGKMQTLINRTLDFLRSAEHGKSLLRVDVLHAIHAAISSLGANTIPLVKVTGETAHAHVLANDWGLERLFANVIDNAVKYGKSAHVEISCDASFVTIAISDHGEGVPVESLARLKEPFYRVDAARNLDNGGAGLGMSIVDNLVRTYGGEWTVRNAPAPATGLIVEIKLPLAGGDSVA